jgi:hypothetical protein
MQQLCLPPFHTPGTPCQQPSPQYYFHIFCCGNVQETKTQLIPPHMKKNQENIQLEEVRT